MEIKYQNYWASVKKLQTEVQLIGRLDLSNKTKYKKKYETGLMSAEDIARINHKNGLHYELSILKENQLFCYLVLKGGHIRANFIDGAQRVYLSYFFFPSKTYADQIFLEEIWYYHFSAESNENEDYRLHFVFDQSGHVSYRKYDEQNKKIQDYESNKSFVIDGLYEPYPEFGHYESVARLERDFPVDIFPANTGSDTTTGLSDGCPTPDWNKK
ncbi:hypothetical protein [Pedobacter caeni]|uniref:Uncharacterized protein n=1 Tax=Pedobacter caeni TaxID=288992 RepID=A0A1M5H0Y5_9SPHI|nr:hypothetical protein [Pedobacter caeni]SHG09624.1 hypothetical protein SAMN04488522_104456 [Pedobacter caeni]